MPQRLTQNEWSLLAEALDYAAKSPEFFETAAYDDDDRATEEAIEAVQNRLRRIGEKIEQRIR